MAIGLSAGPAALAVDPSCQPLIHAGEKQISTPNHVYMTTTRDGKARTREVIMAGDTIYVMVNGKWNRSSLTPQKIQELQAENLNRGKSMTCHYLRDESVNGEAAAVYGTQGDSEFGKTESTIWISKSKSLPLRTEMDMSLGGKMGKSHMSIRYEYSQVKPPA
ncbi:MAG TPA: hypothetical protein VGG20_11075, partial [Thermoanaerobaculia bacterium]